MFKHEYKLRDIELLYGFEEGSLNFNGVVIDNETGNDLRDFDWDYTKANITITGFLFDDKIEILVKSEDNDEEFLEAVKSRLDSFKKSNQEMFAFNYNMEQGNFEGTFGVTYPISEIKVLKCKKGKQWFYEKVKQSVKFGEIHDPLKTNARKCVNIWHEYIRTKDHHVLSEAIQHNLACLIKERLIIKHKEIFADGTNFPLNDNGWLKDEVE